MAARGRAEYRAALGRRIREARHEAMGHGSVRALAEAAGVRPAKMHAIERGEAEPRVAEAVAISRALGADLDALVCGPAIGS